MREQSKGREKMKKAYIPAAAMLSLLLPMTVCAEEAKIGGEIELTAKFVDVNGSKAKFQEYRDLDDGIYGALKLWQESDNFFFRFEAGNVSHDDQSYRFDGGSRGKYKFNVYHNEIPHNVTFDARTPFSGAGTDHLVYGGATPLNNPDPDDWNTFDYQVSRRQQGGGLRFSMLKPFYLDVSYDREEREGIKPAGTSWNLAPGGGNRRVLEMPEPVDYVTDSLKTEIGYALNPLFAAVSYQYSTFNNHKEWLYYMHPNSGNEEGFSLAPDHDYYKVAFKGKVRLPMKTALSLGAGRGVTEGSTVLRQQYLDDDGDIVAVGLSDPIFDGKLVTTNYDVVLTSSPIALLDARLFYKFYEKDNKSDEITVAAGIPYHNHLFGYEKKSYGAEVGFRLPQRITLTPSYQYVKTERHRGDLPESKDKIYGLKAKWAGLDFLTVNAGYERLDRDATWELLTLVTGTQATADAIEPFIRRYDAAPQERDTFNFGLDIYPVDNLSIGLGYRYVKTDYTDTVLGLRDEKSNMYDVTADYTVGSLTLAGYFTYEKTEDFQFQRRITSAANADPSLGFNAANNYNWSIANEFKNYDYGVSAQVVVVPDKWRVMAQYDHVRSDGLGDFTLYDGAIIAGYDNDTLDFQNWDDYKKNSFQVKAIYDVNKNLSTTVGFAYEKYRYNDATLDDYDYRIAPTNQDYLSGAYAAPSYEANVVFCTMKYRF